MFLTIAGALLALPNVGMYYGLHEWTARHTGGVVDARFIALIDTALESPLGQIAMIPMLAWIANSAPANLKATYFAVMASFSNLALSASQLGTKYLNQVYVVSREVRDRASGAIKVPQDYSELGVLLIAATLIGFLVPLAAVAARAAATITYRLMKTARQLHSLSLAAIAAAMVLGCASLDQRPPRSMADLMEARRVADLARANELRQLSDKLMTHVASKPRPTRRHARHLRRRGLGGLRRRRAQGLGRGSRARWRGRSSTSSPASAPAR